MVQATHDIVMVFIVACVCSYGALPFIDRYMDNTGRKLVLLKPFKSTTTHITSKDTRK